MMGFRLAELFISIKADSSQLNGSLRQIQSQLNGTRGLMRSLGTAARNTFLLMTSVIGASMAVTGAYEKSMVRLKAITKATTEEFAQLTKITRTLGNTTVYSAREAADAAKFLAISGFSVKEILTTLPAVLDMAAAGELNLADAADYAVKIMRGMNIGADSLRETVDVMAKAFTSANTDLHQFSEAMSYVGPIARFTNYSLKEVAAAVLVVSNAGVQAERAGTGLRRFLSELSKEASPGANALKKMGVVVMGTNGELRKLPAIVKELSKAMIEQVPSAQRLGKLIEIFGLRAGPAVAAMLADGGASLKKYEKILAEAGGTAKYIADMQLKTFFGRMKQLRNITQETSIVFGMLFQPVVEACISGFAKMNKMLQSMSQPMKNLIAGVVTATAALAAMLLTLIGVASVITYISANPVVALIAALAALAVGIVFITNSGNALMATFGGIWDKVKPYWSAFAEWVSALFNAMYEEVQWFTSIVGDTLVSGWNSIIEYVVPLARGLYMAVSAVWNALYEATASLVFDIAAIFYALWGEINGPAGTAMEYFQVKLLTAFAVVKFAAENWKQLFWYSLVFVGYQIVKFANEMEYFFVKVIPEYLTWFADNWAEIFLTIGNYTGTVFTNMGKNVANFFITLWELLKGNDAEFTWIDLTEGFQSEIKKWPDIAKREIGALESVMAAEVDAVAKELGKKWDGTLDAVFGAAYDPKNKPFKLPERTAPEELPEAKTPRTARKFGAFAGEEFSKKVGKFIGIEALSKTLQTAALKTDNVQEQQLAELKQIKKNTGKGGVAEGLFGQ